MSSSRSKVHEAPFSGPRWWVAALWLALALLAQISGIVHYVAIRGVVPSLVLVAVVWYAIRVDSRRAAVYGLIAGLLEDVFATGTGGAWTVSTTLVAIVAGTLSRGFFADSIPLVTVLVALATLSRSLIFWIVMGFQGYPSGLGTIHLHQALIQSLYNAAVMALATLGVRHFESRFR